MNGLEKFRIDKKVEVYDNLEKSGENVEKTIEKNSKRFWETLQKGFRR